MAQRRGSKNRSLRKGDLKPGMLVYNRAGASIGEIRGDGKKLLRAHRDYVAVRTRNWRGKRKGQFSYSWWFIKNLQLRPHATL